MSVSRILSNMSVETFASLGECVAIGKKWLEEYNQTREGPTKNSIEFHFIDLNKENTQSAINKILSAVKNEKNLLIGVLAETLYTYYDAKATVDMLIDELNFYSYNFEDLYSQNDCVPFQLDFTVRQQELPILGRVLCPAILSNSLFRMQVTDEECLPFLIVLKRIIDKTGCVPSVDKKREQIDVAFIEDFSSQHFCPMLIFDDADLDSAINALVSGAWSYQGKALWTLSHVYVQESLYSEAVKRLKTATIRFLKSNSFYFRHYEKQAQSFNNEKIGDLEIFQPSSSLPHRFFIGWDPREFIEKPRYNCELGLVVMPFRSDDESVALVNKSLYSCAASIWTERIARANSISKKLDMGTVWINCHGLIKPEISLESRKQMKIPYNGLKLLRLLQIPKRIERLTSGKFSKTSSNAETLSGMNEALNLALQASSSLKNVDKKQLWKSLGPLISENKDVYSSYKLSDKDFEKDTVVKSFNDHKVDVVCWHESNKVVLLDVAMKNFDDSFITHLSLFIHYLIGLRNSVVIVSQEEIIDGLKKYKCFDLPSLPKGSLIFLLKNASYNPRELIESSSIQKQIILAEYEASDVSLNHTGYLTKIPLESLLDLTLMNVFLTSVKTVWWPN